VTNSRHSRPDRSRSWSLAARLTVWYAASAFALVLVATAFLYRTLMSNLNQEEDLFLADDVQSIREFLNREPFNLVGLTQELTENSGYVRAYTRVLTEGGAVIAQTPGMAEQLPAHLFPRPTLAEQDPDGQDIRSSQGQIFRALAARAAMGGPSHEARVIQVALSQEKKRSLLDKYRARLWGVLGLALAACALIGYDIARRGMRPIGEISRAAQRVRSTTLDQRIPVVNLPAELLTLATIFNEMLARLQGSFDRLSEFSANIAHELRTPVNNLRGMAEVTLRGARSSDEYRETLDSCLEECVRLSRLIDSLLFLARAEQTQMPIQREPLDVVEELRTLGDFYEAAASEAGVTLTLFEEPHLVVDLDRTLFQRAAGNLITNALTATPRGGAITLKASKQSDGVRIDVEDTGCGIRPEQLPHVFDRFYRAQSVGPSSDHRGVGLGLAIVKSIVTLHGGSTAIASDVGRGTRVTMVFPSPSP